MSSLTPAQQAQVEKVREQMARIITKWGSGQELEYWGECAREIISLEGLAIEDEDQTIPNELYDHRDMLKANFVKKLVIPKGDK